MATTSQLTTMLNALTARVAAIEKAILAQNENIYDLAAEIDELRKLLVPEPTYRVLQGTYLQGVPWEAATWDAYEVAAGKRQGICHYGQSWAMADGTLRPWYSNVVEGVRTRGAIPLVDWSPWQTNISPITSQPRFSLAAIARGDHDAYIRSYAAAAASWGKPVMLRPMWEMNGTWFPWSEATNGNSAGQYVQAWRRIVDVARSAGGTNITWVWCPNAIYPGSLPLAGLYPGDDYVDWLGIDAYAGGVNFADVPFAQMIKPTYDAVCALSPRPVALCEWGYALAAKRPAWLKDALARVFDFPRLKMICYFMWGIATEGMWDFRQDAASMDAWKQGLADPRYAANDYATLTGKVLP